MHGRSHQTMGQLWTTKEKADYGHDHVNDHVNDYDWYLSCQLENLLDWRCLHDQEKPATSARTITSTSTKDVWHVDWRLQL